MALNINDCMAIQESAGKGKGLFTIKTIKDGQKIITEPPIVIGPKMTSPFVCVDCFDYIDEQTGKMIYCEIAKFKSLQIPKQRRISMFVIQLALFFHHNLM